MSDAALDTTALEAFLATELDTEITAVETLSDGLNLVLVVSTPDEEYIVRRPNKLRDRGYINELGDEYGVMERLHDTAIATPEPVLYCDDAAILDGAFFIIPYLDGEVVPLGADLPARFQHPDARRQLAHVLVDTLAVPDRHLALGGGALLLQQGRAGEFHGAVVNNTAIRPLRQPIYVARKDGSRVGAFQSFLQSGIMAHRDP